MPNKTQLQTNNTQLASLIQELNNKAAGGGSEAVETCTVTIDGTNLAGSRLIRVFYSTPDGAVVDNTIRDAGFLVTLDNVLCNSVIAIGAGNIPGYYLESEVGTGFAEILVNGVSYGLDSIYLTSATPGSEAHITYYDDEE